MLIQSSTEGSWSLNMSQEVITLTWRVHPSQTNGLVTLLSATAIPNTTSLRSTVQFRGTYRQRSRPCQYVCREATLDVGLSLYD
ncbi:hypothetical protein EMCRGX_G019831 [Ephydatia muelleri]